MADFGPLNLYSRCVGVVTGINAKTYSAETTVEQVKTPDECGLTAQVFTRNVLATHEWEGEITGGSPAGICVQKVGNSMSAPGGIYEGNQEDPGASLICTRARYSESRGEWAMFSVTAENNTGV